jgi:hypothetical protein
MTFSTASTAKGSTTMATTARIARILIVATGILALSATAAQARPVGLTYADNGTATNPSQGYHRVYGPQALYKADPAGQTGSSTIVVTRAVPQPVAVADSGFNWTAGLLGAGIATLALLVVAFTASRIRPRQVAQL